MRSPTRAIPLYMVCVAAMTLAVGCKSSEPATESTEPTGEQAPPTAPADKPSPTPSTAKDAPPAADTEGRNLEHERNLARLLRDLLEERHLRRKPINDAVSKAAFSAFLENLDPGKIFLLQEDIDALKPYADRIDDQLALGRFDLAFIGGKKLMARIAEIRSRVAKQLETPFDLAKVETFETDNEKRGYAKTMDELSDRWRKLLKLQAIRRVDTKQRRQNGEKTDEDDTASSAPKAKPEPQNGEKKTDEKKADEKKTDAASKDNPTGDAPDKEKKSLEELEKEVREQLAKRYDARFKRLVQLEDVDHIERLVDAVAEVYDPHTSYLPPARKENFDIRMSGKLEGIGAVLQEDDDVIKVARIVPGSASDRQGQLGAEDNILAVAQGEEEAVDIVGMRLRDAVRLIRGPKGTTVKLTVRKPDDRIMVIPIVRDVVRLEATWARAAVIDHPVSGKTGYIELPSFYGSGGGRRPGEKPRTSSGDVRRALEAFTETKVDRVILDLRDNGGGYLSDARRMAGLFIETGPIVQTRTADGEIDALVDTNSDVTFGGLVIVLVDHQSASASEIVAGALKDYERAIVIGTEHTHGKGTVQTLLSLDELADNPDGGLGVMKITQAQFYRVNGESTQLRGVVPDLKLPDPSAYVESGESALDRAIPWDSIAPAKYAKWTKHRFDVKSLAAKSKARIAKDPALTRVDKRVAILKSQVENTVYPLSLEQWQARRKAEDAALDALDTPDDDKPLFKAEPVYYAGTPSESETKTLTDWAKAIRTDPWLNEALHVLGDMAAATKK